MGRLIDTDILLESFRKCYSGCLWMENSDNCMTFKGICNIITNQPTAYDVDKVVEELEHLVVYEVLGGLVEGEWIKKEQVLKIVKECGLLPQRNGE